MLAVKFLHLLALMMGAAASIANLVLSVRSEKAGENAPALLALRPIFSQIGLAAVLLIWITGVWLYAVRWDSAALGAMFTLKLIAAALLLLAILVINIAGARAARTGTPMPMAIQKLGPATFVLTLIAVATAVWVFD